MVIENPNKIMTRRQSRKKVNADIICSHNTSVYSNDNVENTDKSKLDEAFLSSLDDELISAKGMVGQQRDVSSQKNHMRVLVTVKIDNKIFFPDMTRINYDNSVECGTQSLKYGTNHYRISSDSDSDATVDYSMDSCSEATHVYINPDLQTH